MAGAYWLHEFEEAIDCILQSLRRNGVNELRSINLYLQPFGGGEHIEFDDQETGLPFEILKYQGPRRRKYERSSPRLQPEQEAVTVAAALPRFARGGQHGRIEQFIGLLEGKSLTSPSVSSTGTAGSSAEP